MLIFEVCLVKTVFIDAVIIVVYCFACTFIINDTVVAAVTVFHVVVVFIVIRVTCKTRAFRYGRMFPR